MSVDTPAAAVAAEPASERRGRRACLFRVGDRTWAVDVRDAREVVTLDAYTRVPGAPATVLGVFNLRGTVLPLVEARPLLGSAARPVVAGTAAVVLAAGTWRAAVAIDGVPGLEWLDDAERVPEASACAGERFAAATFRSAEGEPVTLLDTARLLAAVREAWTPSDVAER